MNAETYARIMRNARPIAPIRPEHSAVTRASIHATNLALDCAADAAADEFGLVELHARADFLIACGVVPS